MFRKVMTIQKEASERLEDAKAAQMKQTNLVERLQVYPINILMNMVKEVKTVIVLWKKVSSLPSNFYREKFQAINISVF